MFPLFPLALFLAALSLCSADEYSLRHVGHKYSLEYRIYFEKDNIVISPFHDIPLFNHEKSTFNMVVETPRGSNAKMELDTGAFLNPIKQDVNEDGELRFVHNISPHRGYIMNYGYFPQTWENPMTEDTRTRRKGDNDPIDVCEIGDELSFTGEVKEVKVLGVIGLIDEGETDWKIIAIDVKDPLSARMNDIEDVEKVLPGRLASIAEWFRVYKMPDGKLPNVFAFGTPQDKQCAINVISECHEAWEKLIKGEVPRRSDRYDLAVENVKVSGSPYKLGPGDERLDKVPAADNKPDNDIPESVNEWRYVPGAFELKKEIIEKQLLKKRS